LKSEQPVSVIAQELGIHASLLQRWKTQYWADEAQAFPGKGHQKPDEAENRRLRLELARVTEERDILKKALAIFSQRPQ